MDASNTTSVYVSFAGEREPEKPAPESSMETAPNSPDPQLPASGDQSAGFAAGMIGAALLAAAALYLIGGRRKDRPRKLFATMTATAIAITGALCLSAALLPLAAAYAATPATSSENNVAAIETNENESGSFQATPESLRCDPAGESPASMYSSDRLSAKAISWAYPASGVYRINNTYRTANLVGRNTSDDYAYVYLGVGDGDCLFHVKKQTSDGWYTIQAMHNATYLKAWESATGAFGNPGTWFVSSTSEYTYWAFQNGGYGGGLGISNKVWGNGNYLDIIGDHDGYYDNRVNLSSYASNPDASGRGWTLEEVRLQGNITLKGTAQEGKTITATVSSSSYKVGTVICTWYKGDKPGAKTKQLAKHTLKPGTDRLTLPKGCAGSYVTCVLSDDQYRGTVSKTIGPIKQASHIAIHATPNCNGLVNADGSVDFPDIAVANQSNTDVVLTKISLAPSGDMPQSTISITNRGSQIAELEPGGETTLPKPLRIPQGESAILSIKAVGDWVPAQETGTTIDEFVQRNTQGHLLQINFTAQAAPPP